MAVLIQILLEVLLEVPAVRTCIWAVVPAFALLFYVRKKDKLEPESPKLVWSLFGLGAVAVLLSALLELGGIFLLVRSGLEDSGVLYSLLHWYVVVGLAEEASKYLVMRLRTWKNNEFNCLYDGMVYAVAVSAGFALLENIMYLIWYGSSVVYARAIVSIPAHICFAVLMGAWYSAAKKHALRGNQQKARFCSVLAILIPALAHGMFDHLASICSTDAGMLPFILFVIVMFIAGWIMLRKLSRKDDYFPTQETPS